MLLWSVTGFGKEYCHHQCYCFLYIHCSCLVLISQHDQIILSVLDPMFHLPTVDFNHDNGNHDEGNRENFSVVGLLMLRMKIIRMRLLVRYG